MFVLINTSNEMLELIHTFDMSAKGCRVVEGSRFVTILKPNEQIVQTGFEPGERITICPVDRPHEARRM